MKALKRPVELFLFVVAASLLAVSPAHAAVSCHKINAKDVGQDLGGGMTEAQIPSIKNILPHSRYLVRLPSKPMHATRVR